MMKMRLVLFGTMAAVIVLAVGMAAQTRAQGNTSCTVKNFEATIQQGPDKGWSMTGDLALTIAADGGLTGTLKQTNGSADIMAVGQVNGRAINLAFDLGTGKTVFGVGTLWKPISECDGAIGGPLVGPQPGDSGDWGYAIGG